MGSKGVSSFRRVPEVRHAQPACGITLVLALAACSPSGQESQVTSMDVEIDGFGKVRHWRTSPSENAIERGLLGS